MPSIRSLAAAGVLLSIASWAAPSYADPAKYSLAGKFSSHLGQLLNMPLVGDTPCPSITVMSGPGVPGAATPPARTMTRPHLFGCVPGAAVVTASGTGVGAGFVLPKGALAQPLPSDVHFRTFPSFPGPIQAQTSLAFAGPDANAVFRADAWSTQAGRGAADFTWCVGNPACTKIQSDQGNLLQPMIVRYKAGANRFGGTMRMLVSAGANPSKIVVPEVGGAVRFQPIAASGTLTTGAGYAFAKAFPMGPSGSAWLMYMASSMGRITMGTTYLGPRPGAPARVAYGFPFTTGRVLVRHTGTYLGNPHNTTLSAEGGDTVTAMSVRNISLVAGSLVAPQSGPPAIGVARLTLPEPGALVQRLAAVVALLAVAAWRARR